MSFPQGRFRARACEVCGVIFTPTGTKERACSTDCFFLSKVDRRGADECWPWRGPRLPKGYGSFIHHGISYKAHRYSWEHANGVALGVRHALHRCDNPGCVNPKHIFPGTNEDNNADMVKKGRQMRGTGCHRAVLNEFVVAEMRRRAAAGETAAALGRDFGINQKGAHSAIYGRTWKHVPGALCRS